MDGDITTLSPYEQRKMRSHFIWTRGVLGWGVPMAFFTAYFGAHSIPEFSEELFFRLIIWPLSGYFLGIGMWHSYLKQQDAEKRRVALSRTGPLIGLSLMSVAGLLGIACDLCIGKTPLTDYLIPALVVLGLMIIQLVLARHYEEESYVVRTTRPTPVLPIRKALCIWWPMLLLLILAKPLGMFQVLGLALACMILFYPGQRRLYLRSQREFSGSVQNQQ